MKYITKFNYESNHGFQVRVPRFKDGKPLPWGENPVNQFFKKGKGSWKAALFDAIQWRDEYFNQHNATHFLNNAKMNAKPRQHFKSNKTGVIGVSLAITCKLSGDYYAYSAVWSEAKRCFRKQFSVLTYGEKDAFNRACETRYKHAGILIVTNIKILPCKPTPPYILQERLQ